MAASGSARSVEAERDNARRDLQEARRYAQMFMPVFVRLRSTCGVRPTGMYRHASKYEKTRVFGYRAMQLKLFEHGFSAEVLT